MPFSMTWQNAKTWAKADPYHPETNPTGRVWQDEWKYGRVLRGLGVGSGGKILFDWGKDAAAAQKSALMDGIDDISMWAKKAEIILDNPPNTTTRNVLKEVARIEGREKADAPAEAVMEP